MKDKSIFRNNLILCILQAFLMVYGISVSFAAATYPDQYGETVDYLTAQIYTLLGDYSFWVIPAAVLLTYGLYSLRISSLYEIYRKPLGEGFLFPGFLAFCLLLGRSYDQFGSGETLLGSVVNFLVFLIALGGYTLLIRYTLILLTFAAAWLRDSDRARRDEESDAGVTGHGKIEWRKKAGKRLTLILGCFWTLVLLADFPGNICYDSIGQITQVLSGEYSAHHPLFSTLLMGGFVKTGLLLTGSYRIGLFVYVLLQVWALAAVIGFALSRIEELSLGNTGKKVSGKLRMVIAAAYLFSPMYSNLATTAIKDIPFLIALIAYIVLLAEGYFDPEKTKNGKWIACFVLIQILVCILRNNGLYVIALSGLIFAVTAFVKSRKQTAKVFLYAFLIPVMAGLILSAGAKTVLHAKAGNPAEAFSLPFQQSAVYLTEHGDELTEEEAAVYGAVLGTPEDVAEAYDPEISDPVKKLAYDHNADGADLTRYLGVYVRDFFKHPGSYFKGFFRHVYGYFDPEVQNQIRYEAPDEKFDGLIPGGRKVVLFLYRFADRITVFSALQNVGLYTWLLFVIAYALFKTKKKGGVILVPLFVSLLICLASPAFFDHPRYAYAYMWLLPVVSAVILGATGPDGTSKQ